MKITKILSVVLVALICVLTSIPNTIASTNNASEKIESKNIKYVQKKKKLIFYPLLKNKS